MIFFGTRERYYDGVTSFTLRGEGPKKCSKTYSIRPERGAYFHLTSKTERFFLFVVPKTSNLNVKASKKRTKTGGNPIKQIL